MEYVVECEMRCAVAKKKRGEEERVWMGILQKPTLLAKDNNKKAGIESIFDFHNCISSTTTPKSTNSQPASLIQLV